MNLTYNFRDQIQAKQHQLIGVNPNLAAVSASFNSDLLLFLVVADSSIACRLFLCPKTNKKNKQE